VVVMQCCVCVACGGMEMMERQAQRELMMSEALCCGYFPYSPGESTIVPIECGAPR